MQKKMSQKKVGKAVVLVLKSWRFHVSSIANCIVASCECGEFTEPDAHGWLQAMEGRGRQQEPLRLHSQGERQALKSLGTGRATSTVLRKIERFNKKISVYSGNGFLGFFLFLAKLAIIHRKQFLKFSFEKKSL
jgi:hypothetical protein